VKLRRVYLRDMVIVRQPPFPYAKWTPKAVLRVLVDAGFDEHREIRSAEDPQLGVYYEQESA